MRFRLLTAFFAALACACPAPGQVEFLDETFSYDAEHPAVGHWLGNIHPGRYPDTWAELLIERDAEGSLGGTVTIMALGAMGLPCHSLQADGRSVELAVGPNGGMRLAGEVTPDGQRLTGDIRFGDADPEAEAEGSFELARMPRPMDLPRPVAYTGQLEVPGISSIKMTFVLAKTPGGNLVGHADVPAQALMGFPLINFERAGRTFTATLPVPVPARLSAEIDKDERSIAGTFNQGPFNLDIVFPRDDTYVGPTLSRPQHPEPPYPYEVRQVTIEHPDGHTLSGTLTIPPGSGPHPAAVMITGSGPQDRDEQIFGHRPFLVIADSLTRNGIAVLRYDDRGTAQSTGEFSGATSEDFATDVMAAIRFLTTVKEIDAARIGLIGHSEGGLIAPMVAGMTDQVAWMVLLAGPGVRGDELLRVQGRLILAAGGAGEQEIESFQAQQEQVFSLMLADADPDEIEAAMRPMLEAQLAAATGLEGDELDAVIEAQMRQLASPWLRYFITYDPRPALSKVHCPVLALNGTLDLQVWHEQNLPEIEKALMAAGADVTIKRYEGLNHLFQPARTGALMEYAVIETTFDEAVLEDMAEWIKDKTGLLTP